MPASTSAKARCPEQPPARRQLCPQQDGREWSSQADPLGASTASKSHASGIGWQRQQPPGEPRKSFVCDTDLLCTEKGSPEQWDPNKVGETTQLWDRPHLSKTYQLWPWHTSSPCSPPSPAPHQLVLLLHLGDLLAVLLVHLFQLSYHGLTLLTQHLLIFNELCRVKKRHQQGGRVRATSASGSRSTALRWEEGLPGQ